MADSPSRDQMSRGRSATRFEATVHVLTDDADLKRVADLDVDRVPDPEGGVRVLVDPDECARLIDGGFEVRLQRAVPVRPLDPSLVAGDDDVRAWFAERVREAGGAAAD